MIRRCVLRLMGLISGMAKPDPKKNPLHTDQQLTPDQCGQVAESFSDLPPEYQLSAEDLEWIEEDVHGKPLRYGTPQQAIAGMERRIAKLHQDKAKALET